MCVVLLQECPVGALPLRNADERGLTKIRLLRFLSLFAGFVLSGLLLAACLAKLALISARVVVPKLTVVSVPTPFRCTEEATDRLPAFVRLVVGQGGILLVAGRLQFAIN